AASFQERTPTAQRTDVFRPFECRSLAQEAAEARPILELHLADTERFRDSGDERAEVSFGNRPYFDVDRLAALGYPDQTGPLGRTAGQGIEAIRVRRARAANEEASTIGQLMVQRQTAHVRAANDQADVSWRTIGFERGLVEGERRRAQLRHARAMQPIRVRQQRALRARGSHECDTER